MKALFRKYLTVSLCSLVTAGLTCAQTAAQNYRGSNPDQPNGYHASEAGSHYEGDAHMPANQQNGYRASEARSHYGGSKYEPSSGWNRNSQGRNEGPGSAFRSQGDSGRWGESSSGRWGGSSGGWGGESRFGSNYNSPYWSNRSPTQVAGEMAVGEGMLNFIRNRSEQYAANNGRNSYSTGQRQSNPYPNTAALMQARENQLQSEMRNGSAGFNRIYTGE
jgi:hypothetical protein